MVVIRLACTRSAERLWAGFSMGESSAAVCDQ
jgi:hypothetical protein